MDAYPIAVQFFVPGKPQPGGSKRGFVNPKTGRVIITEDAKRNKDWRASVAFAAHEAMEGATPLEGPLRLVVTFHMPRAKGHYCSGKRASVLKPSAPEYPTTKPDATKLLRSTEDAMSGIVWRDDAQVVCQVVRKIYATGPVGAEITVETMQ